MGVTFFLNIFVSSSPRLQTTVSEVVARKVHDPRSTNQFTGWLGEWVIDTFGHGYPSPRFPYKLSCIDRIKHKYSYADGRNQCGWASPSACWCLRADWFGDVVVDVFHGVRWQVVRSNPKWSEDTTPTHCAPPSPQQLTSSCTWCLVLLSTVWE